MKDDWRFCTDAAKSRMSYCPDDTTTSPDSESAESVLVAATRSVAIGRWGTVGESSFDDPVLTVLAEGAALDTAATADGGEYIPAVRAARASGAPEAYSRWCDGRAASKHVT